MKYAVSNLVAVAALRRNVIARNISGCIFLSLLFFFFLNFLIFTKEVPPKQLLREVVVWKKKHVPLRKNYIHISILCRVFFFHFHCYLEMSEARPLLRVKTSSDVLFYAACCVGFAIVLALVTYWYKTNNYAFIAALFIVVFLRLTVNGTDASDDLPPKLPPRTTSKSKKKKN